jgi:hypothetical protein
MGGSFVTPIAWPNAPARQRPARASSLRSPVLGIDRRASPFGLLAWRNEPTITKGDLNMARKQQTQEPAAKLPDFIAYHVQSKGEKAFWTRVGASWLHNDGNGMTMQLETFPIDGRIVLRAPREQDEAGARA